MSTLTVSRQLRAPNPFLILLNSQEAVLVIALVVVTLFVTALNPRFLEFGNISDILSNCAYVAVAAIGTTMVIVSGNIDISMGSALGVCATIAGTLSVNNVPIPLVFLLTVLAGGLIGLANGFLVAYLRIPAIVVTLGMSSILKGGLIIATQGKWIYNMPPGFALSQGNLAGIPNPVLIMFILIAGFWLYLRYTAQGREVYAVGGNTEAARLSGINTRRVILRVFILNGLLVGVASILFATKFSSIQSNVPSGYELLVITSAVIGGVSILGGTGSVIGALLGAIFLETTRTSLPFIQIGGQPVRAEWFQAIQGTLILLAILIDIARRRRMR